MANSEQGGALIVGISDSGEVIGTQIDENWLRSRIYELTWQRLTVSIQTVHIRGKRLLVIISPQAVEPIPWLGVIHWRVKDQCLVVSEETWRQRQGADAHYDWSAQDSGVPWRRVRPEALTAARNFLLATGLQSHIDLAKNDDECLLRRLDVVTPRGTLTRAGSLLFTSQQGGGIVYSFQAQHSEYSIYLPGCSRERETAGVSLLEELATLLTQIDLATRICALETELDCAAGGGTGVCQVPGDFDMATLEKPGRLLTQVPPRALKEALMNAVAHRNWTAPAPVRIWHSSHRVTVLSPGCFPGGLQEIGSWSSTTRPRNRALMRVLAELHLVTNAGQGIATIRREMLKRGMPAPVFGEAAGSVQVRLTTEDQDLPWAQFVRELVPRRLRRDLDLLLLLHRVVSDGYLTCQTAQRLLGKSASRCEATLADLQGVNLDGAPVVSLTPSSAGSGQPFWELADAAVRRLNDLRDRLG